ncbi:MAG: hypothetical protein R3E39_13935 [Anaerolineae bacterium]
MNTILARRIAEKTAELVELTSKFQCLYGKAYNLKPGSPAAAWELYQAILDQQTAIAGLLDAGILEAPLQRLPQWWKRQDVMDTATATSLAQETWHLIAACACVEVTLGATVSPLMTTSQQVIAGVLHPSTRMLAMAKAS